MFQLQSSLVSEKYAYYSYIIYVFTYIYRSIEYMWEFCHVSAASSYQNFPSFDDRQVYETAHLLSRGQASPELSELFDTSVDCQGDFD